MNIPVDILQRILLYAKRDIQDVIRFRSVCRIWRQVAGHNVFWAEEFPKLLPGGYCAKEAKAAIRFIQENNYQNIKSVFAAWFVITNGDHLKLPDPGVIFVRLSFVLQTQSVLLAALFKHDIEYFYELPEALTENVKVRVAALKACPDTEVSTLYGYMIDSSTNSMFEDRAYALEMLSYDQTLYPEMPEAYRQDVDFMATAAVILGNALFRRMPQDDPLFESVDFAKALFFKYAGTGQSKISLATCFKSYFKSSVFEDVSFVAELLMSSTEFAPLIPTNTQQQPALMSVFNELNVRTP